MMTYVLLATGGLLLGVLVNYLADVLPHRRRLQGPVCAFCGTDIGWRAYLTFQPCVQCGKGRRARHRLAPLLGMLALPLLWYANPLSLPLELPYWMAVLLLAFFAVVAIIDLEYHAILTEMSILGALLGLVAGLLRNPWQETLAGGAAGFGIMLLLYLFGRMFGGWLARRRGVTLEDTEALGFGDVNLGGIIGLVMGWPAVIASLFLAIVLGGVTGLLVVLARALSRRYEAGMFMPYAPFLILGAILLLYLPWGG